MPDNIRDKMTGFDSYLYCKSKVREYLIYTDYYLIILNFSTCYIKKIENNTKVQKHEFWQS